MKPEIAMANSRFQKMILDSSTEDIRVFGAKGASMALMVLLEAPAVHCRFDFASEGMKDRSGAVSHTLQPAGNTAIG